MPYLNLRLRAVLAAGLLLLCAPVLRAQEASIAPAAPIRGDVDGDGRVTRADAEAVRAYLVRGTAPGGRSILPAGDANADGRITAADAALISRFAAGVDVSRFPVGRRIEGGGGAQPGKPGDALTAEFECTMDVLSGASTCREVVQGGGMQNIILGDPFVSYALVGAASSRGNSANQDTLTVTFNLTNAGANQPLGTLDGTTPAPGGTRVFFTSGPKPATYHAAPLPGDTVALDNNTGVGTFTSIHGGPTYTDKEYYEFPQIIQPDSTRGQFIRVVYSPNVKTFAYRFLVYAPVQFPHGWITLSPAAAQVIAVDSTVTLSGTVRDQVGRTQADAINWSSSNNAIATVSSSGVVTGVSEGTVTITAISAVNNNRTGTRSVTVDRFPTVTATNPADNATGVAANTDIVITFSEPVNAPAAAFTLECPANTTRTFTVSGSGTATVTLNPDSDLPPVTTCEVTIDGNQITDVDTNDGPNMMPGNYEFDFETAIQANNDAFGTTTTGNVRINSASTSPVFSVIDNDVVTPSTTISFAGWSGTPAKTQQGGDVVMDTEGAGRGTFTYNPPAGFEGTDSLEYTIQAGSATATAKVALPVSGMIWFINNAGAACTTRANGCGRLTNPYSSLAAFNAENNGTGNNPAAGDNIFVYESATTYTGPVTLLAQQKLIGQDAGASLSTISGITPATGSDALPAMNTSGNAATIAGGSGGVVLANIGGNAGANNTVRGLTISTTGGTALSGTSFGSPVIEEVGISATNGPALSLDGGTVNTTFASVTSTSSTGRGISLSNLTGSLTFGAASSVSGATQGAFLVSGGTLGVTYAGSLGQTANAPLVDVSAHATGTLAFSGALTAGGGTGLQFNDADGVYNFSGTANLNGGDAGIDITNGSGGTFDFNASTQITNPTGTGLNVYGSAPTLVTYGGSITKNGTSAGRLVEIGEGSGTVTFAVGSTLSSTSTTGTGIALSNADGTVNFNGTTTLNGGDAGIDILSGSSATVVFSSNTAVTNPSGTALNVNGSTPNLTYNGNLTKDGTSAGRLVDVTDQTGGGSLANNRTITFQNGTLTGTSSAGTGILLSNVDGTVNFNGTTTLTNGDNGVDVENGSAGAVTFGAGAGVTNSANELIRLVNGASGLAFTYSGSFQRNSGTGAGILAQNNSGATITFDGTSASETKSIVIGSGSNVGVNLATNTGSTISFTGNALVVSTDDGAAFTATGGGTVNVAGNDNTLNATGGIALNVTSTTIGASGLNFRSISANGGTNGIVLNNTGSTAGLTVSGNGTPASGGTIQNTTAAGIALTTTRSPSFSRMSIQSTGSHGVSGSDVTNFSFTNGTISVSGTSEVAGRQESNISFYQNAGTGTERNVTGTVTITGNTFTNALHHGINITQYDGTITSLNVSNNTFTSATSASGSSGASASKGTGVNVNLIGSGATIASLSGATISNNVITGFPGNAGILFSVGNANTGGPTGSYGTAADSITIQSNRIRGHSSANLMNTQAVSIAVNGKGTGFFRVIDNGTAGEPITNMAGHAINVSSFGTATLNIRVSNNRIVANNTVGSNGISMGVDSAAGFTTTTVMNATVNANNVSATNGSGILVSATRSGTVNMKLLNNTVGTPATATYGIQLRAASATTATGTVCFQLSGNTTSGGSGGGNTFPGFGLRRQSGAVTNGPNVFGIVGLSPSPTGTPTVENFVNAANTSSSGTFGTGGTALASASSGFTSCALSF